jgi:glutamine synthetase
VAAVNAGYQFNLDAFYDTLAPVTDPLASALVGMGLPLRTMEHETGPGQVETTFAPMTALDTADAMLLFRTFTKAWCARRGFHASFMAQPALEGADPSGWHLNQSVVEATSGRNVFGSKDGSREVATRTKAYAEGLLDHAREFCLLSVPTVNGYRRLGGDFALSPSRIGWSVEDRTSMVRVVDGGGSTYIENRVGEPCANPYLHIAAQLHAGLAGLGGESAPPAGEDCRAAFLPRDLAESLTEFRRGRAPELLGAPLAACLTKAKESELARYEAWERTHAPAPGPVTRWEQREYFRVY